MDTRTLLKKVRQIEIKARRNSDHMLSGEYHSSFKGRGMTFSEVRLYQYGDDVRAIDWNVTAKLNETYVKVFEEERELTLMLLVDISGSTHFGTDVAYKRELAAEVCASLAFSALANNDKVGVLLFAEGPEHYIPPRKGKSHLLRIIREILEFSPKSSGTNVKAALAYLLNVQKKRAIVFVLSDFVSPDYADVLKVVARKYELVGIRLYDPTEEDLPNIGMVQMYDPEMRDYTWVNTASKEVRKSFVRYYREHVEKYKNLHKKYGAGQIELDIRKPYMKKLVQYFKIKS
ncbi:MAG: DUF58 domain-containing protein [Cryomorphaceae bacterium]|nr:DUF58 domain-containing protein [Cryomorphaceae bacterium]